MDLLENPFHILGASSRDGRQRLLELVTERGALGDPDTCARARANLTHPRKRLSAEMAWLAGVAPRRAAEAVTMLQSDPRGAAAMDGMPPLARANLMAAAVPRLGDAAENAELTEAILELGRLFSAIDAEQVRTLVNEDRTVAGLPEVTELSAVEEVLTERRGHFRQAMKVALDRIPSRRLVHVVTDAVARATQQGTVHAPILLDDLVDAYEIEAHRFLDAEAASVEKLVGAVRKAVAARLPREHLERLYRRIEVVIRNWDLVAQPIQLSSRSRGRNHDISHRVAAAVRSLAVDLFNSHDLLEDSKRLTALLQEAFAKVPQLVEKTEEDAKAIGGIEAQRERSAQERTEWESAIRYRTVFGVVFKDPFSISADGIEWKDVRWPLEAITWVRWGGISQYNNGIRSTTYTITFGTATDRGEVTTSAESVFEAITSHLWRAVGVRLLFEMVTRVRDSVPVHIGDVAVHDLGLEMTRRRSRDANMRVFVPWAELVLASEPGAFTITKKDEINVSAHFSYLDVENTHVLEAALRRFWKSSDRRLSSLLK